MGTNTYKYNCVWLLLSSRNNFALISIHREIQIMSFYYEADWKVANQSIMCQTDDNQYILIDSWAQVERIPLSLVKLE